MKSKTTLVVILFLLVALSFRVPAARADGPAPQPAQFALVKCSGLSIDFVVIGEQQFDSQYGWTHHLTTDAQWQASYISRVNEFAALLGCPAILRDDGSPAGALTAWANHYALVYRAILAHGALP